MEIKGPDQLLPLASVVNLPDLARTGRLLHRSTPARWALYGVNGVRLETTKIAGRRFTSAAAVRTFLERCAATSHSEGSELPYPENDNQGGQS